MGWAVTGALRFRLADEMDPAPPARSEYLVSGTRTPPVRRNSKLATLGRIFKPWKWRKKKNEKLKQTTSGEHRAGPCVAVTVTELPGRTRRARGPLGLARAAPLPWPPGLSLPEQGGTRQGRACLAPLCPAHSRRFNGFSQPAPPLEPTFPEGGPSWFCSPATTTSTYSALST